MSDANASAPAPVAAAPSEAPAEVLNTGTEGVEAAEGTPAEPEAAKINRMKKYSLKVNNKNRDVELDLDNDAEVQKYLQKAFAADEKFEEAAMTRKQAEMLVDMLRTNPLAILQHPDLGIDVKALAQQVINQELEDMGKTPEQREMEEMKRQLLAYKEEKKKLEEDKRNAEMSQFEQQQATLLDEQMTAALSSSTLPKSAYVVKRIADAMIEAVNLGYEDVTPDKVMSYVEASMKKEMADMFGSSSDQLVEEMMGKGRLDKYRKDRVAKAKAAPATAKKVTDTDGSSKKDSDKKDDGKKVKFKDVFGQF